MADKSDIVAPEAASQRADRADRADLARFIVAIAGALAAGVGAGLHYLPLGPLVAGLLLYAVAIIGTLRAR